MAIYSFTPNPSAMKPHSHKHSTWWIDEIWHTLVGYQPHLLQSPNPSAETPILINTLLDDSMKSDIRDAYQPHLLQSPNPSAMKPQFL